MSLFTACRVPAVLIVRRVALLLVAAFAVTSGAATFAFADASTPPGFRIFDGPMPGGGLESIALPGLDKTPARLRSTAGEPVLLHVFATWCEPCRDELPRLAALGEQASPPTLYLVSLAEPADRVRRFMAKIGVDHPVQIDGDRALSRALGVSTLPTTIVLDGGLTPRFIAEGDIDWSRSDVRAWLATFSGAADLRATSPDLHSPSPHDTPPAKGATATGATHAPP